MKVSASNYGVLVLIRSILKGATSFERVQFIHDGIINTRLDDTLDKLRQLYFSISYYQMISSSFYIHLLHTYYYLYMDMRFEKGQRKNRATHDCIGILVKLCTCLNKCHKIDASTAVVVSLLKEPTIIHTNLCC